MRWTQSNRFLRNRQKVWWLDKAAKRYGRRPSELVGIQDKVVAFWFDDAVAYFGEYVEARLEEKDEHGHRLYSIEGLLQLAPAEAVVTIGL